MLGSSRCRLRTMLQPLGHWSTDSVALAWDGKP